MISSLEYPNITNWVKRLIRNALVSFMGIMGRTAIPSHPVVSGDSFMMWVLPGRLLGFTNKINLDYVDL